MVVLGAGHIGETVVARLLAAGHPATRLRATTRTQRRAEALAAAHGIVTGVNNAEVAAGADVLVLAVRPPQAEDVLRQSVDASSSSASIVSLVAGYSLDRIERIAASSSGEISAFRVASNVASLQKAGVLAISSAPGTPVGAEDLVLTTLRPLGTFIGIPESHQNVAASTLGSGAAFLALAATGVVDAATSDGVPPEHATLFAAEALECAAALLRQSNPAPANPWESLATPGGITEAGINSLRAHAVSQRLSDAVQAAVARANALATTPSDQT
ncbi:NAD(P)-binding domain-containing protein [Streptomyces sp. APSN-46.1]|uniref:pyrroline-5-carboxylate reductase family protein n=1 Tax=Streptomyces sp. APSN-46.1 TaxID=2929049 RepID=UPI001FB36A2A|nr:pyrroline-5-carboxylate reductase dimerization domain-containing protein [Streptomyces sp. APSN-46.1]MCJ1681158.1 NAD(P)-binding domain-containing protein [Streptomyces sp. APSN-46.1]